MVKSHQGPWRFPFLLLKYFLAFFRSLKLIQIIMEGHPLFLRFSTLLLLLCLKVENKKRQLSYNCFKWKELCHLPIKINDFTEVFIKTQRYYCKPKDSLKWRKRPRFSKFQYLPKRWLNKKICQIFIIWLVFLKSLPSYPLLRKYHQLQF